MLILNRLLCINMFNQEKEIKRRKKKLRFFTKIRLDEYEKKKLFFKNLTQYTVYYIVIEI